MADALTDLAPVTISFQDGETPASGKLNTWASQTETAFLQLSRLLGDLYNTESPLTAPSYVLNLSKALGNMGSFQSNLPTIDIFRYRQTLVSNRKQHLLHFPPRASGGVSQSFTTNVGAPAVQNACISSNGVGWQDPDLNYVVGRENLVADKWTLVGRILYTEVPSGAGNTGALYVEYEVDNTFHFPDATVGANVVPSLEQISNNVTGGPTYNNRLCTIVDNGAKNYTITLPTITHATQQGIAHDFTTTIQGALPNYCTPAFWQGDLGLVVGNAIPEGEVQLWFIDYNAAGAIVNLKPVRNLQGDTSITYTYTDRQNFIVQLPSEMDALDMGDHASRHYICVFNAYGLADRLEDLIRDFETHTHSGGSGLVDSYGSHGDLDLSFNPTIFGHSRRTYNDHPNYLERLGVNTTDSLNGGNSMIGHLHLGSTKADGTYALMDQHDVFSDPDDSYKLLLGLSTRGEGIWYHETTTGIETHRHELPTDGGLGGMWIRRATGNDDATLYLGKTVAAETPHLYLTVDSSRDHMYIDTLSVGNEAGLNVGALQARSGILYMADPDPGNPSWDLADETDPHANATFMRAVTPNNPSCQFEFRWNGGAGDNVWASLHAQRVYVTGASGYQTGYYKFSALDVVLPTSPATTWTLEEDAVPVFNVIDDSGADGGDIFFPLHLPNGVVIEEVGITWQGGAASMQATFVTVDNSAWSRTVAAQFAGAADSTLGKPGGGIQTTTSAAEFVGDVTVDNTDNDYYIRIESSANVNDKLVLGGYVKYRYTELIV